MSYKILEFNIAIVGPRDAGKTKLFPEIRDKKKTEREVILSEVESDVHLKLQRIHTPFDKDSIDFSEFDGIIGVYDATSIDTYEELKESLLSIKHEMEKKPLFIVGNKLNPGEPCATENTVTTDIGYNKVIFCMSEYKSRKEFEIRLRWFAADLVRRLER
ncbi:MAG: hypothetical protein BAJATHORv1_10409 [Candidatus Thorarchaeota archaeon]|nr:MAG: hypothetical protein BAJATHORv1_10409 [Candidatus Thorarchaeota archaeon]